MMKHYLLTAFVLINITFPKAENENDLTFPIPDILKDNVAFWKKIYTEISLGEGLIHDRDYPMVIYERVKGDYTSATVKSRKESIAASLRAIILKQESMWTENEKEIYLLYLNGHGDTSVFKEASERIRFQQGQKERFREGLERSGMYLDTIRAILKAYKVPLRLAYLPHVESSFNTEAYSKVGAAGLWQFMRGTGKIYGMKIDYSIDERRDPIIASVAAAKYLSSSYAELKSWPLAITSYNHGVYGMKRAVAQTGSSDIAVIIQKYSSRSFRFASSNFYGCFLAASEIADNYSAYFPNVTLLPAKKFTDVKLAYFISTDIICMMFDVTREEFADLNPAIRPAVFDQKKRLPKGFTIHLPSKYSQELAFEIFSNIPDSLKSNEPERPNYYYVAKGDNLDKIASRLGVSVKELALENNITKYNRIHTGQVLRVPGTSLLPEKTVAIKSSQSNISSKTTQPKVKPDTQLVDSSSIEAAAEIQQAELAQIIPPEETTLVSVKFEDKISSASQIQSIKYKDTLDTKNVAFKKKEPATVKEEKVIIEQLSDSLKDIALAPALAEPEIDSRKKPVLGINFDVSLYYLDAILSSGGSNALIHVSIDETIGHYADWLGIPTWRIRKLNDMGRTSNIRVNEKLRIPVDRSDALERFSAARLEYHMAIEEDFYSQYMISDVRAHILKRGQTLWHLCNEGDTPIPLWLLKKYNKQVDLNRLTSGVTVWIPIISELTQDEIDRRSNLSQLNINKPYNLPVHNIPKVNKIIP